LDTNDHIIQRGKVIVLILSFNGKDLLDDSVSSYLANDYPNFEVVVIDNGSTDGTKKYVESKWPEVKIIRTEKNLGYSGGFNFGLKYAFDDQNADYVLITNNDVKADLKVISELVKMAEKDEKIGFVTGKVYYYDNPNILQTIGYYEDSVKWIGGHIGAKEEDKGQYDRIEERFFTDDIFMLVTKPVYIETNGYDEEFQFQAEQFDWQIRSKKEGFKIFYTPFAKIWHKESMTIGKSSPFKTYYDVRNTFVVRLLHRDKTFLKKYYPWYFKNVIFKPLLKNIMKLKWNYAYKILHGYLSAVLWGIKHKRISINGFSE